MIRRDLPTVLRIEQDVFSQPWDEDNFLTCLRQRNCIGMIAELDAAVVGYMLYELHRKSLVLLNMAVARDCWRQGIGAQLIEKLKLKLTAHARERITATVRERNLPAQLFFRGTEFKAIQCLRNYYEDTHEDAIVMALPGTVKERKRHEHIKAEDWR